MALVKKEVEIAKELDDVMALVVELVKDIKAGKGAAELASENIGNLMTAVSGIDQVQDELKLNKQAAVQGVALRVAELVSVLLPA